MQSNKRYHETIILNVNNLTIRKGSEQAGSLVKDLSFKLISGKTTALIGESGSGKSLTALSIMRLLPHGITIDSNTQILLNEQDLCILSEFNMQKIRGREIALIFQDPMTSLNPVMTIQAQIAEAINLERNACNIKAEVLKLLAQVKIADPAGVCTKYPHQLSGGMQQRVVIAMALAAKPKILIADEPTTALDLTIQAEILELLAELQSALGMSLLFITHDLAVAAQIADTILVMKEGILIEKGEMNTLLKHPQQTYTQQLISIAPTQRLQPIPTENKNVLEVKNLKVFFPVKKGIFRHTVGLFKAVDDLSFSLKAGETLALVGESGSGKTTVGKSILSLIKPTAGEVIFEGQKITHCNHLQMIVQDPFAAMNPRMQVIDIIQEGLLAQKIGKTKEQRMQLVDKVLEQVHLDSDYKTRYPHQLSGGQRQRVCIARALILNPKVLICDEPTSSLDVVHQAHLMDLLLKLQAEYGLAYLLITHNLSIVRVMAHTVAVMLKGRIVEYGTQKAVFETPQHAFTKRLLEAVPMLL